MKLLDVKLKLDLTHAKYIVMHRWSIVRRKLSSLQMYSAIRPQ